jgi:hypothetical protein
VVRKAACDGDQVFGLTVPDGTGEGTRPPATTVSPAAGGEGCPPRAGTAHHPMGHSAWWPPDSVRGQGKSPRATRCRAGAPASRRTVADPPNRRSGAGRAHSPPRGADPAPAPRHPGRTAVEAVPVARGARRCTPTCLPVRRRVNIVHPGLGRELGRAIPPQAGTAPLRNTASPPRVRPRLDARGPVRRVHPRTDRRHPGTRDRARRAGPRHRSGGRPRGRAHDVPNSGAPRARGDGPAAGSPRRGRWSCSPRTRG